MDDLPGRLRETLRHEIPLTGALGLDVESYDGECLTLRAPLAPNINHKDTAFAGSLSAVVTLTGWGLLWLVLEEAGLRGKIVIQDSTIAYLLPVAADFAARCCRPPEAELSRFLGTLRRRGRARIELRVEIRHGDALAVAFAGRYVVHLSDAKIVAPPASL